MRQRLTPGHTALLRARSGLRLLPSRRGATAPDFVLRATEANAGTNAGRARPAADGLAVQGTATGIPFPRLAKWAGGDQEPHAALAQQYDYAEALDRCDTALRVDPDYAMAHALRSTIHTRRQVAQVGGSVMCGRWQARQAMNRALLLDPANPFVLSLCSEAALYSAGDIDHAAALLELALPRDPNDANELAMLGNIRRLVGDDPRSTFWHHHAAWYHWKLADFAAMEAEARRGLELYGGNPLSWVCLICALGLQERWEDARGCGGLARVDVGHLGRASPLACSPHPWPTLQRAGPGGASRVAVRAEGAACPRRNFALTFGRPQH